MALTLQEIASRILNEAGQEDVEELLSAGNQKRASEYLLGAVDRLWEQRDIDDETARTYYNVLGVPGETAAMLRQNRGL